MTPPLYAVARQSAAVRALLGDEPRIYAFGENDDELAKRIYPYVTWQIVPGGSPYNYLGGRPDADRTVAQIDVWAETAASVRAVAVALRDAIELSCYITSWRGQRRDDETGSYRVSFDCDWITER